MKIGIIDLDTSHPENWIPVERELGHEVVGVWDGGAIHPLQYVERFAEERHIPRVYVSLEQMAEEVDCAVIHGCDWDTHIEKALPFVEAGKSVLLDKPLAGRVGDLKQLCEWAEGGVRVSGGSSLRFCWETRDWLARPVEERGSPHTVLCGCAVDEFNYGIHAYSMLSGIMGPGARSVRHLGKGVQRRIEVKWDDGRMGLLVVGKAETWIPFYASVSTERSCVQFEAKGENLYRALLEATLPYLSGQTDEPPVAMRGLIEPELCALAARKSWLNDDRHVPLSELADEDGGYDGAAFAGEYRKSKYPSS